jgi:hypothetical protein
VIFPPIRPKIPLVGGQYPTMPDVFGQYHQRSVGQVHRQIGVFFHQLADTRRVEYVQFEYLEQTILILSEKFPPGLSPSNRSPPPRPFAIKNPIKKVLEKARVTD